MHPSYLGKCCQYIWVGNLGTSVRGPQYFIQLDAIYLLFYSGTQSSYSANLLSPRLVGAVSLRLVGAVSPRLVGAVSPRLVGAVSLRLVGMVSLRLVGR